jgi:hypothetical protein
VVRSQNQAQARRDTAAVVAADIAGTSTVASEAALTDFVESHTGATVSYTLQGSYDRAVAAAKAVNAAASAANSQIYAEAQRLCSGKTDSLTQARCNQDYLGKHLQSLSAPAATTPGVDSFRRQLKSPVWALDLAGALLTGCAAAVVLGMLHVIKPNRRKK